MIISQFKNAARNTIAPFVSIATVFVFVIALGPGAAHAAGSPNAGAFIHFPKSKYATEYVDASAVNSSQNGSIANPFLTINAGLATLTSSTSQATTTFDVAAGTYTEDLSIPQKNFTLQGAGAGQTILNSDGSSANAISITGMHGFVLDGFTVNASPTDPNILYSLNAYEAHNLTLSNDIFNGVGQNASGAAVDGIGITSTNGSLLSNLTITGYGQDGVAVTSKFLSSDPVHTTNITFNSVTSTDNGQDGIAFYTVNDGNTPVAHRVAGATFTGTNVLSRNLIGLLVQGASTADYQNGVVPGYIVVSNPTQQGQIINPTLDINNVNFSQNLEFSVVNYQTAAVNALSSQFNGLTGNQMSGPQRTATESHIYDQRVMPSLGLVTFFNN